MTDQTCKNCRWWDKTGQRWGESACRPCIHPGHNNHSTRRAWPFIVFAGSSQELPCSGYRHYLSTGPDFGCIHFERKDDNG